MGKALEELKKEIAKLLEELKAGAKPKPPPAPPEDTMPGMALPEEGGGTQAFLAAVAEMAKDFAEQLQVQPPPSIFLTLDSGSYQASIPYMQAQPVEPNQVPPLEAPLPPKKAAKKSIHLLGAKGYLVEVPGVGQVELETPKLVLLHFGVPITDVPCRQILVWAKKAPEKAQMVLVLTGNGSLTLAEAVKAVEKA